MLLCGAISSAIKPVLSAASTRAERLLNLLFLVGCWKRGRQGGGCRGIWRREERGRGKGLAWHEEQGRG